jgi:hypothetical protein
MDNVNLAVIFVFKLFPVESVQISAMPSAGLSFVTTAPQWGRASSFTRFLDHNDAPQLVGLRWTSDQLVAETST